MLATFMEVLDTSVANVALPAHRRQPLGHGGRSHLGAHLLPGGQRRGAAPGRLPGQPLRAQALLHDLRGHLHRLQHALRPRPQPALADLLPRPAGRWAAAPCSPPPRPSWWRPSRTRSAARPWPFYGMGVVLAPIMGPVLGGWITDNYSWHWIFLINIPVGILSLVLTYRLIFDPPDPQAHVPQGRLQAGLSGHRRSSPWAWPRWRSSWTRASARTGSAPTSSSSARCWPWSAWWGSCSTC